jgi:cytochrome b subunit of formate dehydrogenase
MRIRSSALLAILAVFALAGAPVFSAGAADIKPAEAAASTDKAVCLGCHGNEGFSMPGADGRVRQLHVPGEKFEKSVHGAFQCTMCHQDITSVPHSDKHNKVDCGMCHADQKKEYLTSVHGQEQAKGNTKAATCVSCHTNHAIMSPKTDAAKLAIVERCGGCHAENYKSYQDTYHGQVTSLGFAYTAKCFDCHGNHGIKRVADPDSTVHPFHRLQTCQKCHTNATQGFVTFQPHANTHDYQRYPLMWIVSKFMLVLIIGVFAFFWAHSALWFYREYKDHKDGVPRPHIVPGEVPYAKGKYYQRFGGIWRLAHLLFALSLMVLSLTGMAVFYARTEWAETLMHALGGPRNAALIHRVAAVLILSIFLAQLAYFVIRLAPRWRTFKWFGHTSLVPSLQDLKDIIAQFKWFFGLGPRPQFGRWNYLERFDYWAPFWGLTIVGGSGIMLWFKEVTASVWPGWMFNIAALAHGEEAFLAIVFLFTVHFFNNHFRPDKLPPPDVVMFTGAVSIEEFKREHTIEYNELVASGKLKDYLVDVPSPAMKLGARILGLVLLACGLTLLTLVLIGFVHTLGE